MWIEMGGSVQQAILTAHQVSSAELLGISTPGALGSRDHLEAQDHYNRLVISPTQVEIKKIFEKLLTLRDGIPAEIEIKQFKMVSLPDEAPIETINVDKTEGLDINKNETIN
jgi:hypothetical protein